MASSFQWGGRRSPSLLSKCCKLVPWCLKGLSGLSLLLLVAVCSGQHGPVFQVARVIGAVADLGEATTSAAVSAINVTNTMAAAASTVMVAAANNGLTAGANMWHGVELADIRASKCGGAVVTADVSVLRAWLDSAEAKVHFPCLSEDLVARLMAAAQSLSMDLPSTQATSEDLQLVGKFASLRVAAFLDEQRRLHVQFEVNLLHFVPLWANPVWTSWGFNIESEREQILRSLRLLLLNVPSVAPQRAFAHIDLEVALPSLPFYTKMWAFLHRVWGKMFSLFCRSFQGGGLVDAFFSFPGQPLMSFVAVMMFLTGLGIVRLIGHCHSFPEAVNVNRRPIPLALLDGIFDETCGVPAVGTGEQQVPNASSPLSDSSFCLISQVSKAPVIEIDTPKSAVSVAVSEPADG